jgi:hypothetical protein
MTWLISLLAKSGITALFKTAPVALAGLLSAAAGILIQKKIGEAEKKKEADLIAQAVVENHAVAQAEQSAQTDEEADAALDAAAHADQS